MSNIAFHYPPELLNLLVETIPLLNASHKDLSAFFQGAGIEPQILDGLQQERKVDGRRLSKFEVTRRILVQVNAAGDSALAIRREILKRVVSFENFSACWPADQLKAKGLVAEVREIVNERDAFSRMNLERKRAQTELAAAHRQRIHETAARRDEFYEIRDSFRRLFGDLSPQKRGIELERVLNRLFDWSGILIKEAFSLQSEATGKSLEQIDGAIEIDGALYLVEMKWWADPLGGAEVSPHLVKVFGRAEVRGLHISASGYTESAITAHREALKDRVVIMCKLEEIANVLEDELNLLEMLRAKVRVAMIDKNPICLSWPRVPEFPNEQ